MTTALTPIGKVVAHPLRGDQAYATKDIEWADPSKPYSGAIYSAEPVETLRKRIEALEAELAAISKEAKLFRDAINDVASAAGHNNDLRVYQLMRGLLEAIDAALAAQEKA